MTHDEQVERVARAMWEDHTGLAWELPKHADHFTAYRKLARAALSAMPAQGVRVKPLVWEEPCAANNYIYQAHAPWGTYGIHICGGRHQAWLEAHEKPYERWLGDGFVGSLIEAQRDAEAHHRATALGWLEPMPVPTVQEAATWPDWNFDMASAPRNAVRILVLTDNYGVMTAHFDNSWHLHACLNPDAGLVAWMHLPKPAALSEGDPE